MARVGIVFGLLLCGLSIATMVTPVPKFPSQFVPMMIGVPIFFLGIFALNPRRKRLSMRGAATVGLIGLIFGVGLVVQTGFRLPDGDDMKVYLMRIGTATAILCLGFVGAYVSSFLQASKSKAVTNSLNSEV